MAKIKENLVNIKTSSTLEINELSLKLEKEGNEIYKFGLGQSPFPVPDVVVKELQKNAFQKDYLNVAISQKSLPSLYNIKFDYLQINLTVLLGIVRYG